MDDQKSTGPYDASQDDAFLLSEMDTHLKERWQKAIASGNEAARLEVGQALAYLAGLSHGRFGMTAAELDVSLEAVSRG
jgi:hypothetical protein